MLAILPFSRKAASAALSDPDTYGTVLHLIVLTAYGAELYGDPEAGVAPMDPVELYARIKEDFRAELSDEGENRLQAILLAVSTDAYFVDMSAFAAISQSLSEGDLGDLTEGILEDITVPEVLWGTYEVLLNRDDSPEFSAAITAAIQNIVAQEADDNDKLEVGEVIPYYQRFVENQKLDLVTQLVDLGLDPDKASQFVLHQIENRQTGASSAQAGAQAQ